MFLFPSVIFFSGSLMEVHAELSKTQRETELSTSPEFVLNVASNSPTLPSVNWKIDRTGLSENHLLLDKNLISSHQSPLEQKLFFWQ